MTIVWFDERDRCSGSGAAFIAGFFVTVPLFISVATLLWLFRLIDGFVGPFYAKYLGPAELPGLGHR